MIDAQESEEEEESGKLFYVSDEMDEGGVEARPCSA